MINFKLIRNIRFKIYPRSGCPHSIRLKLIKFELSFFPLINLLILTRKLLMAGVLFLSYYTVWREENHVRATLVGLCKIIMEILILKWVVYLYLIIITLSCLILIESNNLWHYLFIIWGKISI